MLFAMDCSDENNTYYLMIMNHNSYGLYMYVSRYSCILHPKCDRFISQVKRYFSHIFMIAKYERKYDK